MLTVILLKNINITTNIRMMKKIILTTFAGVVVSFFSAQTLPSSENYVYSRTYLEPITSENTNAKQIQNVKYYDGLGQLKQKVSIKSTPSGGDLVVPVNYNSFGIQTKDYLPLPQASLNGNIHQINESQINTFYNVPNAYAEREFESYSVNRVKQEAFPGEDWKLNSGHTDRYGYDINRTTDNVKKYSTITNWDSTDRVFASSVSYAGNYTDGELYKYSFTNEDNNIEYLYKDELGHTILERKNNGGQFIDTYYVYNEYNRLVYIIPPMAASSVSLNQDILDNFCYQYKYDDQKRLVEKKLPGRGIEYFVYDKSDKEILRQDANMRLQSKWFVTKYDKFNRTVYTGMLSGGSRISMQNIADNIIISENRDNTGFVRNGMAVYYSNNHFNVETILTIDYYDTYPPYNFNPPFPDAILGQSTINDNSTNSRVSTNNSLVLSLVKNIEDDNWTKEYSYFNKKKRLIGTYIINHLGGYTKVEKELDFVGITKQVQTFHKKETGDAENVIVENFEYDNQNRLKKHWHKINNNNVELLSDVSYDELSKLTTKKVGNNLQTIDYKYNIRGWLTNINNTENLGDDLFGYHVKYQNPKGNQSVNKYNGNISEIDWITQNDQQLRRYTYLYDGLDRLLTANYSKPNASVIYTNAYNESVSYDLNGNITNLQRNGSSDAEQAIQIDNLDYSYLGNRLINIIDKSSNNAGYPVGGKPISYDSNGNIENHTNRGINQIKYNFLDLPNEVHSSNLFISPFKFFYTYNADGTKLRKRYTSRKLSVGGDFEQIEEITDYLGDFQYSPEKCLFCASGGPILQFVTTSEGYYDFYNQKYIYNYKDQVGNVRLSYSYDAQKNGAVIWNENNYYPFGLKHSGYNNYLNLNAYQYSFQEQEGEEKTGWYSFKWRNYDPTMGRFFNIDPLSEKYAYQSHYNFSENRVVDAREIEGLEAWVYGEDGPYFDHDAENRGDFDYVMVTIEDEHEVNNIGEIVLTAEKGDVPDADEAVKENDPRETGIEFLILALTVSQADSPLPGPGDAISIIPALIGLGYLSYAILTPPSSGYTTIADPGAGYGSWNTEGDNPYESGREKGNDSDRDADRPEEQKGDGNGKPTRNERIQQKKAKNGGDRGNDGNTEYGEYSPHTKGASKGKRNKHEEGEARKDRDRGGEKGDARRKRYK